MDPHELERELRGLAERVRALEDALRTAGLQAGHAGFQAGIRPPAAESGAAVGPAAATSSDLLPSLGRALLALAAAYLLRALVESESLPAAPGVAIGILYAMAWLVWAARTPAGRRLETALHSLTSALILAPLLWEGVLRFNAVRPWAAALILLGFTLFGLAISWRKNLLIVATIATLAGLLSSVALLVATHDVVPFVTVILAVAAAVECSACLDHWLSERWLAAGAADLGVLLATYLVTNERGLPEAYAAIPHAWLVGAQVALLALYLASIIVRTLFRRFQFTAFETMQCIAAFAISVGGGLRLSPAMPIVAVVCGAACYVVAFAITKAGRNFYTYSTFGLLLATAGSRILLTGPAAAGLWATLAVAGAWSGRATLQAHALVYLLLALAARGFAGGLAPALATAVCLAGAWRSWLRIPLFLVFAWLFGDLAADAVPPTLRHAVRLVIYGAALIALPKLRTAGLPAGHAGVPAGIRPPGAEAAAAEPPNPTAAPECSETSTRPHDSAEKSDTASSAG